MADDEKRSSAPPVEGWIRKCVRRRNSLLVYAKVMPYYDNLRGDPRFSEFIKRLGLGN